jgi:hypothetical protein
MKTFLRLTLGAALLGSLATGCQSTAGNPDSAWNVDSVDNRIVRHFTGYRGSLDGRYLDYQREKKADITLTLRRHFLNSNPENPFQALDSSYASPKGPYGPLPNPFEWFHVETLVYAAVTGIPIPVDSLLALTSDGGGKEWATTFLGNWTASSQSPPSPSTFEVKNK